MVYLCETQASEWESIAEKLGAIQQIQVEQRSDSRSATSREHVSKSSMPAAAAPASPRNEVPRAAPFARPPVVEEDPERARLRMRMAHVIRGYILIFALGLPRIFYYLYGIYGVFVLSGLLDKLQSAEFRRLLTGTRPSLDVQLARLRQRQEMFAKLEEIESLIERDEEFDADEYRRVNEFLSSFNPIVHSGSVRFAYQLFFMFFLTALPSCHPDPEFLK
jgi:hypothetical protein